MKQHYDEYDLRIFVVTFENFCYFYSTKSDDYVSC